MRPETVGRAAENLYNTAGISFVAAEPPTLPGQIEGKIVAYSESGDLISDIAHDRLRDVPRDMAAVACDEHETIGIFPADHPEQPLTLLAVLGNSGCLELTIVGESAKSMLGVRIGERIVVKW